MAMGCDYFSNVFYALKLSVGLEAGSVLICKRMSKRLSCARNVTRLRETIEPIEFDENI
jgi:hypothetical protein